MVRLGVGNLILALATWLAAHSGVGNLAGSTFWRWQPGWQHILALATWLAAPSGVGNLVGTQDLVPSQATISGIAKEHANDNGVGNVLEVVSYGAKVAWRCLE